MGDASGGAQQDDEQGGPLIDPPNETSTHEQRLDEAVGVEPVVDPLCFADQHHDELAFSSSVACESADHTDPMLLEIQATAECQPGVKASGPSGSSDLGPTSPAAAAQVVQETPTQPRVPDVLQQTPAVGRTASAEQRLQQFADQVAKPARKPLLRLKTPRQKSPKLILPSKSRRIAAQCIAHISASKRGEYLVRKRLGEAKSLPHTTAAYSYDDIFRDDAEHTPALRELFPPDDEVGPRKRGRRRAAMA